MAGKRQHHVWQMLQRGFSWKEYNDDHVWVYEKGHAPKQTVTRKFGFENYFYGATANENITDFENKIGEFVHECRLMKHGETVDRNNSAALLAHLEMRSLFLRNEMSKLGDRILELIKETFSSRKHVVLLMSSYFKNHPEFLTNKIDDLKVPKSMQSALRELMIQAVPQQINDSMGQIAEFANHFHDTLSFTMSDIVKSAHNKALEENFSEVERTKSHLSMNFHVFRPDTGNLILPDTSLVFFQKNGCAPISQKDDKIDAVVIPISSSVAIIGKNDSSFQRDIETIRRALASCAHEAFLSNERSANSEKLSTRIGKNARMISDAELNNIVRFDRLLEL